MGHPGNRIPVLGWRRRRYSEDEYRRLSWGGRLLRRRLALEVLQRRRRRARSS